MAFFESFSKNFTMTPNRFFDEILFSKGTTFNEAKLVGFLLRNTIGFNNKNAWTGVSRNLLIQKANISYGSINDTIKSCVQKGWVLDYKVGQNKKGNQDRYLFLSTEQNIRIVYALEKKYFVVDELEEKNDIGIEKLLKKFGLSVGSSIPAEKDSDNTPPSPESTESQAEEVPNDTPNQSGEKLGEQIPPEKEPDNKNECSCTNSEQGNECSCTNSEHVSCSKLEHQDMPSTLEAEEVPDPLNTSFKYKKDNVGKNNVVVSYQKEFEKHFGEKPLVRDICFFMKTASNNGKDLIDYIHYVHTKNIRSNPIGYLRNAVIENWDVPCLAELEMAATRAEEQKANNIEQHNSRQRDILITAGVPLAEIERLGL